MFSKAKDQRDKEPAFKEKPQEKQTDLIWFDYETRLRKLIEEILEPTVKRSREERELFEILSKKNDSLTKRIEDLEFMSQRTQKRQTAFEDIFKKLNELETTRKGDEKVMVERIETMKKSVEEVRTDISTVKANLGEVDRKAQNLSKEFITSSGNVAEYKTSIFKNIEDLRHDFKTTTENQQLSNKEFEFKIKLFDEKVTETREIINKHDTHLSLFKTKIEKLTTKSETLEAQSSTNTETISDCLNKVNSMVSFKHKIDSLENQLRIDENYIEKYLPLYTQVQIADSIHSSLIGPSKKKHALYEQKRLQELISDLRKENVPTNLAKKIDRVYDVVDPSMRKYTQEYLGKSSPQGKNDRKGGLLSGMDDDDSDSEAFDSKIAESLDKKIKELREETEKNIKGTRDELIRKFMHLTKEQVEMSEGINLRLKEVASEIGQKLEGKVLKIQEEQVQFVTEMMERNRENVNATLLEHQNATQELKTQNSQLFGDKPQAFFKCLSDTLATITEALNGVIAILLKEERDKNPGFEEKPQAFSQIIKDIVTKKKGGEEGKGDTPTNKDRNRPGSPDNINRMDFLMMIFENFKSCLVFSTKYRVSSDFLQFFEAESSRFAQLDRSLKKESPYATKNKIDDLPKERGGTPQPKSRNLNMAMNNSLSQKSSYSELNSVSALEKKANNTGNSLSKI